MTTESEKALTVVTMLRWVSTTPLGTPVEPDVYMMMAVSSGHGELFSVTK